MLRRMLGGLGILQVEGATNSREVLSQLQHHRFDVVLSDYYFEDGRDGQQLLEELRQGLLLPPSTVYMLITSERSYQSVASIAELGPDGYLVRPFSGEQLNLRLVRALRRKNVLKPIHLAMEQGSWQQALAACDSVSKKHPRRILDILRLKAEVLLSQERGIEAEEIYRRVLNRKPAPWAKIGLAYSLKEKGAYQEAALLVQQASEAHPEFLAAYDLLADLQHTLGYHKAAQATLDRAARISPHNSQRLRKLGSVALRNQDLAIAIGAYRHVLERHRGTDFCHLDDYANLCRAQVEGGQVGDAQQVLDEMRRLWRGQPQCEFCSAVMESRILHKEGKTEKAREKIAQSLKLFGHFLDDPKLAHALSPNLVLELGDLCLEAKLEAQGKAVLRRLAGEYHDNEEIHRAIKDSFAQHGLEEGGQQMLEEVSAELVWLNNRGVMAAREGDLLGSVTMLMEAAAQVPSTQFLCNAAKAIFTLLDQQGWDEELAQKALDYIDRARFRSPRSNKVSSAQELYRTVATKYGVPPQKLPSMATAKP